MKLIPKNQEGNKMDKFINDLEPWADGIGLTGAGIGLAAIATGYGAPVGAAIYRAAQIPSIVVDGYQTVRSIQNNDTKELGWNLSSLALDMAGAKAAQKFLLKPIKNAIASYEKYIPTSILPASQIPLAAQDIITKQEKKKAYSNK